MPGTSGLMVQLPIPLSLAVSVVVQSSAGPETTLTKPDGASVPDADVPEFVTVKSTENGAPLTVGLPSAAALMIATVDIARTGDIATCPVDPAS